MLMPKKTRYRKMQRRKRRGKAWRGCHGPARQGLDG